MCGLMGSERDGEGNEEMEMRYGEREVVVLEGG